MTTTVNKKISIANILVPLIFFGFGLLSYQFFFSTHQRIIQEKDMSLFWKVWNTMEEKYPFAKPSEKEQIYAAIEGLVDSYDDDYSQFLPPVQSEFFNQTVSGVFAGIGAEIAVRNGFLTVVAPLKESPAEKSGILPGDIITHVNDVDITGETLDGAISKIRGEENSIVTLTIYRAGESEARDIEIRREIVKIPVLENEIIDDTFIVHLYNFNEQSEDEFKKAMIEFKESGLNQLVIDVRNNPGGFLLASIEMASYFLPQGTVVLREYFGEHQDDVVYRSYGYDLFDDINPEVIILQNGGSASASEIIAGALSDNGVAKIAGEQSYGKGSVQQLIELPEGTALKVTIAQWLTPKGQEISEVGITPDYEILPDYDSIEDIQLQETLKLFN